MHGSFLIFCMKLQQDKVLKLTGMIFFGENLALLFFGKKMTQEDFFEFINKMTTCPLVFTK